MQFRNNLRKTGIPLISVRAAGLVSMLLAVSVAFTVPSVGEQYAPADDNPAFYQGPDFGYRNPDWMGRLPDDLLISELSIPGAHETVSRGIHYTGTAFFPYLWCHSMGLKTLLEAGIRILDMRCQHDYNHFLMHHAGHCLFALFGDDGPWRDLGVGDCPGWINVLRTCVEFLRKNPSETILMRVQWAVCIEDHASQCGSFGIPQNTDRSFAETFAWYRDEAWCEIDGENVAYRDYFWKPGNNTAMPTLGEVRGKIVILQEFPAMYRVGSETNIDSDNYRVCSEDFNGDSFPDLVATIWDEDQVAVLLNRGDKSGTFHRAKRYNVGTSPNSAASQDFNGDSFPDIAVTNYKGHSVSILLNKGDNSGEFYINREIYVGTNPRAVIAADFNGDSYPDLATANWNDNNVAILLNTGDGTGRFYGIHSYYTGNNPRDVVSADFNGDSYPDIAVTNWNDDTVTILLNTGDGTGRFHTIHSYGTGASPWMVCSGDFDGDSYPDIAVTNWRDDSVAILLNTGDGTGRFFDRMVCSVGTSPLSISSADYNGDSFPDLSVTNYSSRNITVLLNKGDGTGRIDPHRYYKYGNAKHAGLNPSSVISADFNGDGYPDLAVMSKEMSDTGTLVHYFVYDVAIYQNRGDRTGRFLKYGGFGISWEILQCQDWHEVGSSDYAKKWTLVSNHLDAAITGGKNELYANFLSGSTLSASPWEVAEAINPPCFDKLSIYHHNNNPVRVGMIMADLPGAGLVDAIIRLNDFSSTESVGALPASEMLFQNNPNPFNPSTTIEFDLPRTVHVKLCVYNVKGELIATLLNQQMTEGRKEIAWSAKDNRGRAVASGIYFYRLVAGDFVQTKKMVLLR
jgi:hypothetical protein